MKSAFWALPLAVLVVTIGLARWYLRTLTPTGDAPAPEAP